VGYVRVSTNRQAERGLGLPVQRQKIRAWAKANGHRLVALHEDAGVSGGNGIDDRDGLPLALNLLHDRQAEGLVVIRLDRLARDLMVQEAILAKVWDLGAHVFTAESGEVRREDASDLDDDGPYRTAMRQMMGVFGQLEKAMIVRRLKAGRRLKADRGGYAYGSPPYGQKSDDHELVPDEQEQATIDRIKQLHADGQSFRSMAAVLTAEGHRPKRSDRWHSTSIRNIVVRL
jgi:DNA invertase Pin-like site-specific DNA recombinase